MDTRREKIDLQEDARRFFSQAVEFSSGRSDVVLARVLIELGRIERDLKNTHGAIDCYLRAASIYRSTSDPLRLAHTIRHVGDILRGDGRPEEAKPYYEEAVGIYRQDRASSTLDVANALRGFALLNEDLRDMEQARVLWREARQIYAAAHVQAGVEESAERLRVLMDDNH